MRRRSLNQGDALSGLDSNPPDTHATISRGPPVSHERTEETSDGSARLVNAVLVVLAFGLLGLVIWQNKEKIREVFSRPLDLKLLVLALAVYFVGHDRHLCAVVLSWSG